MYYYWEHNKSLKKHNEGEKNGIWRLLNFKNWCFQFHQIARTFLLRGKIFWTIQRFCVFNGPVKFKALAVKIFIDCPFIYVVVFYSLPTTCKLFSLGHTVVLAKSNHKFSFKNTFQSPMGKFEICWIIKSSKFNLSGNIDSSNISSTKVFLICMTSLDSVCFAC